MILLVKLAVLLVYDVPQQPSQYISSWESLFLLSAPYATVRPGSLVLGGGAEEESWQKHKSWIGSPLLLGYVLIKGVFVCGYSGLSHTN